MKKAPHKAGLKAENKNSKHTYSKRLPFPQPHRLCEPLRRLRWLRQEIDFWNQAEANRPMPQPRDFGIRLPNLKPSDVHWRAAG